MTYMKALRTAWEEWFSAFDAHKRCQENRREDGQFYMLQRLGLIDRSRALDDVQRLENDPSRVPEPDLSMVKKHL